MRAIVFSALLALLSACGTTPPTAPPSPADTVVPNAHLSAQGIPPIPRRIVDEVARYNDFRGHGFVAWHPARREMLVTHRLPDASTTQLFRISAPMAAPELLTDGTEPVRQAQYEPVEGRYIVFARSVGGDEADQLYRLDLPSKQATLLTDPRERHQLQGWMHASRQALVVSSPLDRTAQGGTRAEVSQALRLIDPMQPASNRVLAVLPGTGWGGANASPDDRLIAITRYLSAGESQVWLLDVASRQLTQLLPAAGRVGKASWLAGEFTRDGSALHVLSDERSEFRELALYRLGDRSLTPVTAHIPWDVSTSTRSDDGCWLAAQLNVDGREELRLFDGATLQEVAPPQLPAGSVRQVEFHPRLAELAMSIDSTQGPSQIHTLNPVTGALTRWTQASAAPGIDPTLFADQRIVRWPSFDGRSISGILATPPARFTGKRPVLVAIHGGPEGQAKLGFMGRGNYYTEELGFAVVQPNVRGSTGYGKTFLALDNGMKREDSVKDIGALLDWIATQPGLDASRVVVTGGSYGGYMSLAVATNYADRIAGAIDVVGISNFVSFLTRTESYRRDLRRVEYGDERDPAMRAFLERISPLNNAAKIRKPLFIVQGKNDPRVPVTEAEQMVARLREIGTPVWYLLADNEGHGFARKENADFQFYATVMFLREAALR